jgi:protoporphyrinogen oxidase
MTIGILGGGLAGCILGRLFLDEGWSFEILEALAEPGGLMKSAKKGEYTFDVGGPHILFTSKNEEALEFVLSAITGNVSKRRRNNKILFKSRYVKYPFENGLSGLPIRDNMACLAGFSSAAIKRRFGKTHKADNLQDWCLQSFGKGISRKYLLPYNEKIWKYPPRDTSTGWVERIPNPPWKDVFKSSLGIETEGYTHQLNFSYPTAGGIQSIIEGLTEKFRDRIVTNFEVKSITRKNGKWIVSDGKREKKFDAIVSTLPLPTLAQVADLPPEIDSAIESLNVNSIVCVLLGGVEPVVADLTAIYIPDKTALTHRVSFMSTFSDHVAPPGKTSLTADITCRFNDETWNARDEELIERTVKDLVSVGVLKSSKMEVSLVSRHKFAYVIDDKNRAANVAKIRSYLTDQGILTCGRFAEFEYLNMDAVAAHAFAFIKEHKPKLASAG